MLSCCFAPFTAEHRQPLMNKACTNNCYENMQCAKENMLCENVYRQASRQAVGQIVRAVAQADCCLQVEK